MHYRFTIASLLVLLATPALSAPQQSPPVRSLNELSNWVGQPDAVRRSDAAVLRRPLSKAEADAALELLAAARSRTVAAEYRQRMAAKSITIGDRTLRWESRQFGDAPFGKRSLWISMHGGGNAAPPVNDRQWRNQIKLYEPAEGIYLAPRAPTDSWNLWHEAHIDPLFQRLIDAQVAINGVDPDRVYLLGYSAGGDGVWQLAPRMADRFAAASMMAGHPNEAGVASLRNLPFGIFMGGADAAYDRNRIAAEKSAELGRLHAADPDGYVSMTRIYPGLPHWMDRKDAEALPWMAGFTRNPWPRRIVWVQDDVTHDRFYWLRIPDAAAAKAGDRIDAVVAGQTITLTGTVPAGTIVRLSDRLVDLDKPVRVVVNGRKAFAGKVPRTATAIVTSLEERLDPASVATALVRLP
jgi:dienelactone hydrolase